MILWANWIFLLKIVKISLGTLFFVGLDIKRIVESGYFVVMIENQAAKFELK